MVIDAPRAERLRIIVALCPERLQNQNMAFKHSKLEALLLSHQSCSLVALKHNLFNNLYSWIAKKYRA